MWPPEAAFSQVTRPTFHPIPDASVIDTTTDTRACSILQANDPLTLSATNLIDVPDGITAVSLNVTAVNGSSSDHLTVYPTGSTAPSTPSVQFASSAARSNAVIVPVDANGDFDVLATQAVGVAITVNGYFTSTNATSTYSYTYDIDGLRTSKTGPEGTTVYDWDKTGEIALLVAETTDGDTTRYLYGPGGLVYQQTGPDASVTFLHHDQLGSTRLLTDAAGAVTGTATYEPHGSLAESTGTLSRFGYAGQYSDTETGLQYLRARYYDPDTGQFLSRDPLLGLSGDPYGYAFGDPVNMVDPSGELAFLAAVALAAVVGGGAELASQVVTNLINGCDAFHDIDWGAVVAMAIAGAATEVVVVYAQTYRVVRALNAADDAARAARAARTGARIGGQSADDLARAAKAARGDYTAAGHALTKHAAGQRGGSSAFPALSGNPANVNRIAQSQIDDILANGRVVIRTHPNHGPIVEVFAPDGRGARWYADGRFFGFLEP